MSQKLSKTPKLPVAKATKITKGGDSSLRSLRPKKASVSASPQPSVFSAAGQLALGTAAGANTSHGFSALDP